MKITYHITENADIDIDIDIVGETNWLTYWWTN